MSIGKRGILIGAIVLAGSMALNVYFAFFSEVGLRVGDRTSPFRQKPPQKLDMSHSGQKTVKKSAVSSKDFAAAFAAMPSAGTAPKLPFPP